MSRIALTLTVFLLAGWATVAPKAQELLLDVDPAHTERLIEYNWGALQETLYHAARHRVVTIDGDLLLRDDPITITPFLDVERFVITPERICRHEHSVSWHGRIMLDPHIQDAMDNAFANTPELQNSGISPGFFVMIHMYRWEVDAVGIAAQSRGTRPVTSANCADVQRNAPPSIGVDRDASEMPQPAPSEEAEPRGFLEFRSDEFGSVSTSAFRTLSTNRYMLQPLPYTPKYSLVIELDEEKFAGMPRPASDFDRLSEEEKTRIRAYQERMSTFRQMDVKKPMRAELE